MKLWEVLKALEENPKKVFEANGMYDKHFKLYADSNYYFRLEATKNGKDISDYPGGGFSGNLNLDDGWTEVKQPVTWQEALEVWAVEGKDISCEIGGCKYLYTRSNDTKDWLIDSADNGISNRRMTLGTWYIE